MLLLISSHSASLIHPVLHGIVVAVLVGAAVVVAAAVAVPGAVVEIVSQFPIPYISFQLITKISRHQIQQCSMADFGACPLYKNNFGRQDENLTHLTLFPTLYLLVLLRIWY